jgi:hypothetical protein
MDVSGTTIALSSQRELLKPWLAVAASTKLRQVNEKRTPIGYVDAQTDQTLPEPTKSKFWKRTGRQGHASSFPQGDLP